MATPIKLLKKGSAPSMMDTATANELITAINAFRMAIVSPAGFGKFVLGEKDVKLDLGPLAQIITNLQKASDAISGSTSSGSGGGGGSLIYPFQIQEIDSDTVNVRYGTMQDIAPTNVATDISVSGSATHTFYLDVEVDIDGLPIAVTLSHGTSGQPADEDYHGYITLGQVVTASSVITTINQAATHSLRFSMCNRVVEDDVLIERGTYEFWGF